MAIRLTVHPCREPLVGKSHWWGEPDLPEDMPYPCTQTVEGGEIYDNPLTFVCQIKCSDIADLDKGGLLPHKGFLYFFAPLDYFLGEEDSPLTYHDKPVVLYSEQEDDLEPYEIYWEESGESIFKEAEAIDFSEIQDRSGEGILLLGKPYQDEIRDAHPDCISLLQIDENDDWGLRFYDCGMYYFLLSEDDIKNGRWNRVEGDLFFY